MVNYCCIMEYFVLEFRKGFEKKSNSLEELRESSSGERRYWIVSEHGLGAAASILESDVVHTL